jgi:tripartite-type tricarboxylate transporter receptor subunit TctC
VQSLVGGHTPIGFLALPPVASNIKSGSLRCLVVLAKHRSESSPTCRRWRNRASGMVVLAGTPRAIVDWLQRETPRALRSPRCESGFQPVANTPEECAAYIKADIPRWGKVTASIRID